MILNKWDDYLIHQMAGSINKVESEDLHWFDRMYFGIGDPGGSLVLNTGLGTYPNAQVMDGFACVSQGTMQRNIRFSRRLQNDRADMWIGPLTLEVLEPLRRWSLELGKNDYGIDFSLEFQARSSPYMIRDIVVPLPEQGTMASSHFTQLGRYSGWVAVDGNKLAVDGWGCIRDRSWGLRPPLGTGCYWWHHMPFSDRCITLIAAELDGLPMFCDGAILYDNGELTPIVSLRHRLNVATTGEHLSGELALGHPDGRETLVSTKRISQGPYLSGGGYGWSHGVDRGQLHIEGEELDISSASTLDSLPIRVYCQIAGFSIGDEVAVGWFEGGGNQSYQYKPVW